MAEGLGAIIVTVPLGQVNGFYQRYLDQDIIYINQELKEEEQIIVCAHELGHMVLHHDIDDIFLASPLSNTGRYELEANTFAIQLLQCNLNLRTNIPLLDWDQKNYGILHRVKFHYNG